MQISNSTKRILSAVLIFLSGAVVGAASFPVLRYFGRPVTAWQGPVGIPKMVMDRLQRELDLSPSQVRNLTPVIVDIHARFESLRDESSPKIEEILEQGLREAEPLLLPEQKKKLEGLKKVTEGHILQPGPEGPGGPGPDGPDGPPDF